MPEYNGKNGGKPEMKTTYTPEMRDQYRDYYKNRNAKGAPAQSAANVQKSAAQGAVRRPAGTNPAQSARPLPRADVNGTKLAGADAAVRPAGNNRPKSVGANAGGARPAAQGAVRRPAGAASAQGAVRRSAGAAPAQGRPVQRNAGSASVQRSAQQRRRKSGNPVMEFLSSLMGGGNGGGPQYGRMLLCACVLVLLMFGLVKGIGALTRDEDPDYIVATKITEAPTEEPAAEPTAEPTAIAVSDEGYFPEGGDGAEEAAPTQQPESTGEGRVARLRFAGDIVPDTEILKTAYNSSTDKYDFNSYFDLIRDQLTNADFTSLNVDGSMGGAQHDKYGRYTGYPQFNTPPTLLYALKGAGVDMLTLANNHCLDGWFDGLLDTIKNCDYVGMQHVGAFTSQEDFDTPEILDINGIKVGFLNYTQSLNSMDTRGVDPNALVWGLRRTRNADYEGDIKALRNAGAEVVIVVMHWGDEYLFSPDQNQVAMANRIAAAGADVIVGGHPHVFQAAGWKTATLADGTQHKCLLVYSLGNFLSEHRNEKKARTDAGIIFEFTLKENTATGKIEVVEPAYLPIAVWRVGSEGAFDYRVVSIDAVLQSRPGGMNDSAFARIQQASAEMDEVYGKSGFTRLAY